MLTRYWKLDPHITVFSNAKWLLCSLKQSLSVYCLAQYFPPWGDVCCTYTSRSYNP